MFKWVIRFFLISLAIAIMAVGVNMFLGPHQIAAGGLTGLSIILETMLGFHRSVIILIGNAIVLVCALIFLGREVFLNTVIGASLLPIFIKIVPNITVIEDIMLSMLVGSVLFGVAVSILYHNKASSGGTAIPPLIFHKHFGLRTSIGLFITDGIVVALCLLVFSLETFFYAVFSIFITSAVMHYIETGLNKKKMVYIVSNEHEGISRDIMKNLNRGVTIIPAVGAYNQTNTKMLMVTMNSREYRQAMSIVNSHDKEAFMVTDTVTDVHGKGFSYEPGSV